MKRGLTKIEFKSSHLPLDADLAGADMLFVVVGEVKVRSVPGKIGDEDHLVNILTVGSVE